AGQRGVDLVALGAPVPASAVLAYARDAARGADDVGAYLRSVGKDREVRAVLRPGHPDTDSADRLVAKARAAKAAGASAVDFYAYGLMPLPVLDRIPAAPAEVRCSRRGPPRPPARRTRPAAAAPASPP